MKPNTPVVAIVDDDQPVREALVHLIRSLGYAALEFADGRELLDSTRRAEMSCLISDVQMPGMSGFELYAHLVAIGEPIPTILITAYPNDAARARALNAGVVCYLKKPYAEQELLACLKTTLGLRQA